jgi:hypothetical protein
MITNARSHPRNGMDSETIQATLSAPKAIVLCSA